LATYNTYKTYYLGTFASAPTLDNQGNALITGATYFSSTTNTMYVYNGSSWSAISSATSYSAPTLGSTTINSGTTYANVSGLTINSTTIPTSKTIVVTTDKLSVHAATTSAELAGVISDETGSGSLVFATAPTLSGALASADPTADLGLATKQYVDAVTASINFHAPVQRATTAALTGTYNNGSSSGVGATFTLTATGRLSIDGGNVSTNDRVLLKDQASQIQNGIYIVTNQGGAGVSAVLTRATDYDTTTEVTNGDIVFTIAGTQNTGVTFVNTSTNPVTIGTTAITFSTYTSASLPTQTGNSGRLLTTDGTTPSWTNSVTSLGLTTPTIAGATISGTFTSTAIISGGTLSGNTHTNAVLTGTLTANGSAGTNGYYLQTTGSGVQWAAVASDPLPQILMLGGM
jgi:hypothetical protein